MIVGKSETRLFLTEIIVKCGSQANLFEVKIPL